MANSAFSKGTTLNRGYLSGFILSNNLADLSNDIDISPGLARDSADVASIINIATFTKRIDANWALGNGQGGFPSSLTLTNNTWYHFFAIRRDSDGVVDYGFDTSLTATNLLADATGFTRFRRIGSIRRGVGAIDRFVMQEMNRGDAIVYWRDPPLDANNVAVTTTPSNVALTVPPGVRNLAKLNYRPTTNATQYYIYPTDVLDEAASTTVAPLSTINAASSSNTMQTEVLTDVTQNIRHVASGATNAYIVTYAFVDFRVN